MADTPISVLAVIASVCLLTACSFGSDAGDDAMAAVEIGEQVELLSDGDEPRFALRYRLAVDQQVNAVATDRIQVRQRLVSSDSSVEAEPIEVDTSATVTTHAKVTVTGSQGTVYTVATEVTAVELVEAFPAEAAQLLGGVGEELSGVRTVRRWDDRGRRHGQADESESEMEKRGALLSANNPLISSGTGPGADVVSLPAEPVGQGARWRIARNTMVNGDLVAQLLDVTLLSVTSDGDGAARKLELRVEGGSGDGQTVGESTGRSTILASLTLDLTEPLASGDLTSSMLNLVDVDTETGDYAIEQTTDVVTTVETSVR